MLQTSGGQNTAEKIYVKRTLGLGLIEESYPSESVKWLTKVSLIFSTYYVSLEL